MPPARGKTATQALFLENYMFRINILRRTNGNAVAARADDWRPFHLALLGCRRDSVEFVAPHLGPARTANENGVFTFPELHPWDQSLRG
jgi:hypothetical protein